jgi:hypothetical protein
MDPMTSIMQLFLGGMASSFKAQADAAAMAQGGLGYAILMDNRLLTGALMSEMFTSSDPSKTMDFNTAARTPTTLGHELQSPNVLTPSATK